MDDDVRELLIRSHTPIRVAPSAPPQPPSPAGAGSVNDHVRELFANSSALFRARPAAAAAPASAPVLLDTPQAAPLDPEEGPLEAVRHARHEAWAASVPREWETPLELIRGVYMRGRRPSAIPISDRRRPRPPILCSGRAVGAGPGAGAFDGGALGAARFGGGCGDGGAAPHFMGQAAVGPATVVVDPANAAVDAANGRADHGTVGPPAKRLKGDQAEKLNGAAVSAASRQAAASVAARAAQELQRALAEAPVWRSSLRDRPALGTVSTMGEWLKEQRQP